MKQLLNTLYITMPETYLACSGNDIVIMLDQKCIAKLPMQNFESVVTFGYSGMSPSLMQKCLDAGIAVTFMSNSGHLRGRLVGKRIGNVYLRQGQYQIANDQSASLKIAKNFILGKVYNQRWIIERFLRDHPLQIDVERFRTISQRLKKGLDDIQSSISIDELRGIEGRLATDYYSIFDDMIINQKDDFYYHGRNRRPPLDRVNSLLSLSYSLLRVECASALAANGLDTYIGFMHVDRPGRESLALDLMEELRGVVADRFVLRLINKQMVHANDFIQKADGATIMTDEARKRFLTGWQKNKMVELNHPYLKEKIEWGLVPFAQAQLLARCIRGDTDGYAPFLWK